MAKSINRNTTTGCKMNIPDYAIERIARCMLPMIQQYYDSEVGKQELSEWEEKLVKKELKDDT